MDYQQLFSLIPKEPRRWTQNDVESWLEYIGLNELIGTFQRNAIDGACLEVLNEDDLNELGIASNVKKKKLLQWISSGFIEYKQFVRGAIGQNDWCITSKQMTNKENKLEYTPIQRLQEIQPSQINKALRDSFADNKVELVESMKVTDAPQIELNQKFEKQRLESTKLPSYPKQQQYVKESQHNLQILDLLTNKKITINEQGTTFGRNPDSGIICPEDYISRNHCQIYFDQKTNFFYLKDVGSSSGTFILLCQPSLMKQGLILHMGSMQYRIEQLIMNRNDCDVIMRVIDGDLLNQKFQFQLVKNQNCVKFGRHLQQFQSDSHLSGNHAQFSYTDDGLIVEDMESRNGIWVRLSEQGQTSERVKLTQDRQFRLGYEKIYLCE